jgi:6-phosphogluconolactonase (cycloisomerase 2 family)
MKFRKYGRASLAAVLSLGVTAIFTACGPNGFNNTVDYIYVTNSKQNPGQVFAYYLDFQSGALTPIPDSPYPSGGRNPVAAVTSPNFKNLYVLNHDDNTLVQFTIGTDAKLYPQHTYNTPGTFPNAMAINSAGTFLFVTDTYQPQYTAANPGPGAVVVYPINTDGSLGTPVANGNLAYYPLSTSQSDVLNPTAINALSNGSQYVYVVDQNSSTGLGSISAFSVDAKSGALTAVACSSAASICSSTGDGTFNAGTTPNAIASTPLGLFVYVTDSATNQLISYTVQSSGQIVPSQNGPTRTDVFPDAVTVDPRGQFIYVANYNAASISAYTINTATGYPTGVAAAGTYATGGAGPTCIFVEPALGRYVYTTNFLDGSVGGQHLDPNTGTLSATQNSPYLSAGQPTCMAGIPHGNHALSTPVT